MTSNWGEDPGEPDAATGPAAPTAPAALAAPAALTAPTAPTAPDDSDEPSPRTLSSDSLNVYADMLYEAEDEEYVLEDEVPAEDVAEPSAPAPAAGEMTVTNEGDVQPEMGYDDALADARWQIEQLKLLSTQVSSLTVHVYM